MSSLLATLEIKLENKLIEKLQNNTDCEVKVMAACIGKTKVIVEVLEP